MSKMVKKQATKKIFQDTSAHREQMKLVNTRLPTTENDKRIAVPFDVIHPKDVLNHYYHLPEHITSKDEKEFIEYYVKMLSERLLIDALELLTKGIEYLDATRDYKYSYDRCKTYYSIVLVTIELLKEIEGSTYVVFYRMFNIPYNPRNHYREVPFEDYPTLIPDTTGIHDEVRAEKDPKRRKAILDNSFLLEDAWRAFINKIILIREDIDVGLRLSLQYSLAHYPFCFEECCDLPAGLAYDDL